MKDLYRNGKIIVVRLNGSLLFTSVIPDILRCVMRCHVNDSIRAEFIKEFIENVCCSSSLLPTCFRRGHSYVEVCSLQPFAGRPTAACCRGACVATPAHAKEMPDVRATTRTTTLDSECDNNIKMDPSPWRDPSCLQVRPRV